MDETNKTSEQSKKTVLKYNANEIRSEQPIKQDAKQLITTKG